MTSSISGKRRPKRSASSPKITAPTGLIARLAVRARAISARERLKSRATSVRTNVSTKKSKASRVQPKNPASKALRWFARWVLDFASDSCVEIIYTVLDVGRGKRNEETTTIKE